ncbi:MAG: efflux RND transporter periplasmic adaptor subunit [Bacteroidaceae bacterium]|nr:efflux RND transporter periplasmic adaptor subunit [Bacteroidaceae bacterium]
MRSRIILMTYLAAAVSCGTGSNQNPPLVKVCEAVPYNSIPAAKYTAKVSASDKSDVAFRVSGKIRDIKVKPGDYVSAGQLIAELDDRDYIIQLTATTAEYNQVKAEIDRVMAMYEDSAISENDYDKARYGLEQISQKLAHHQNQLDDCCLYAPFSGYIDDVLFSEGETVVAGVPVISVFDDKKLSLTLYITYADCQRYGTLDNAFAEFQVRPDKPVPLNGGQISRKANSNQMYRLQFDISDEEGTLTPGMTAMVTLSFCQDNGGKMLIAANSIFHNDGSSSVLLYNNESCTVESHDVEIVSILKDGNAVVLGLKPGDEIVSAGVGLLHDGQKVRRLDNVNDSNPGGLL